MNVAFMIVGEDKLQNEEEDIPDTREDQGFKTQLRNYEWVLRIRERKQV